MIQKYYLLFRNTPLVIFARSEEEALEPWRRINCKPIAIEEFRSALVKDDSFVPVLSLLGKTVRRSDIESLYRSKPVQTHSKPIEPVLPATESPAPVVKRGRGRPRKSVSPVIPEAAIEVLTEAAPDIAEMAIEKLAKTEEGSSFLSEAAEAIGNAISGLADFIQID